MASTAHSDPELIKERYDPPEVLEKKIDELAEMVRKSRHFVVFTGAGISTDAGIPDFRGPEGAWTLKAQGRERMVYNSKRHDMKLDRYDANNHVDYCFIEQLMDESMNCSICNRDMQLITTNVSLCTLMQKSLKVGFLKSNCVLGCFDCKTYQQGCGTDEIFELYKEKNNYKTEIF